MEDFEIRDLIVMAHYGIISPEDKARLEAILASNEEARALRAEIEAAVPQQQALEFMERVDTEKAHAQIFDLHARKVYKRSNRRRWLAAAAVIAGILATGYFLYTPKVTEGDHLYAADHSAITLQLANGQTIVLKDSGQQIVTAGQVQLTNTNRALTFRPETGMTKGWNTLTVPPRLDYRVELSDGSVVWLNSTSKMRFPFAFEQEKREVYIEGEAYFEVMADSQRPFIVHANNTNIQVLGTSFNVNAYFPNRVTTSLVTGKVALETGQERIALSPGKEAIIQNGAESKVQNFDTQITLGWKQGVHYFENAPMREIAEMIPRWFNERIVIDDSKAGEATFRIKIYRHQPLKEFINQINSTRTVVLYYKDGILHCRSV
ncbi:FecR domain-containing protein [Chitinophaga sp. XS-30]|uniref:FecR domain-containing protein n=1 Tax=Chitinophaga sp. XS-30 TaxID=2604421 RepID=UPI0011DCBF52|nr:FecR domain-containing protein [Chitinophaga sp. XS-30]QEH39448.1 DUF4974 domain-containing protein [Chitinophaga sp. XS-30]